MEAHCYLVCFWFEMYIALRVERSGTEVIFIHFLYRVSPDVEMVRIQAHLDLLAPQSGALRISAYGDFQSQPNPSIHL